MATGTIRWSRTLAEHWLHKAGTLRSNLYSYGLRFADVGVIGATPEVLFETKAGVLRTMALAGTRPAADTAELGESPKDLHEHELVKDFLREVLSPLGKVAIGQTGVRDFGQLHHLHTPVSVTLDCAPSFEGLVASLHPTPALGTSPRCPEGEAWLQQMDAAVPRGRYGSPFGVRFGNGDMLCLVAIRNVQFSGKVLRVWSGCGVVPTSQFENEWSEICVKSETILKTWDVQMNASL